MRNLKVCEYNSYLKQINLLVKVYTFLKKLKSNGSEDNTLNWPFWLLRHFKSKEIDLVYQTYNKKQFSNKQHYGELECKS